MKTGHSYGVRALFDMAIYKQGASTKLTHHEINPVLTPVGADLFVETFKCLYW